MKKNIGIGLVALLFLVGCTTTGESVQADLPSGFEEVTQDSIRGAYTADTKTLQHKDTGCYFVLANHIRGLSIEQIYIEENGLSVPYCDEK